MKNGEKYSWVLNHQPPELGAHSKIKHQILRGYLDLYVRIIFSNINTRNLKLTVIDGFAGGGEYLDRNQNIVVDGSPLIAVDTIRTAHAELSLSRKAPIFVNVEYHFVDAAPSHVEYLTALLHQRGYGDELNQSIFLHEGVFAECAQRLVDRIIQRSNRTRRAIFILDQYSYLDVPFFLIRDILRQLPEAEFIITFNYESLMAYLNDSDKFRRILSKIDLLQYISLERINALKEAGLYKAAIQEQLSAGIKEATQARYMTLYFLGPEQGWSYWLVHLSNSFRANEAMTALHWQTGNSFSHSLSPGLFRLGYQAKQDAEAKNQLSLDFSSKFNFNELARISCVEATGKGLIQELFRGGAVRFKTLRVMAAMSPATREIIADALDPYIVGKELRVQTEDGGFRRSGSNLHDEDLIIPHQRSFFIPT